MSANNSANQLPALNRYRYLLLAATLFTFLLMVMGSIVRVSAAGQACPDWPTCYGSFGLPAGDAARIQVVHRGLAALAAVITWAAAGWAALRPQCAAGEPGRSWPPRLVMLAEVLLGGGFLQAGGPRQPGLLQPLHLILAMLALGLLSASTLAAFWAEANPQRSLRLAFRTPFARLALAAALGVFTLMLSGALVTALNAGAACVGWPLCAPQSGAGLAGAGSPRHHPGGGRSDGAGFLACLALAAQPGGHPDGGHRGFRSADRAGAARCAEGSARLPGRPGGAARGGGRGAVGSR